MEQEIKRLKDIIKETNPLSADYSILLENLSLAYSIAHNYEALIPAHKWGAVKVDEPKVVIEPVVEPTPMAESVSATVVADEKPVATVKVEAKGEYTKEEVRALLSTASKSGIQIQPIIEKYVPEGKSVKFSEVPASAYAELVEEIKNAG